MRLLEVASQENGSDRSDEGANQPCFFGMVDVVHALKKCGFYWEKSALHKEAIDI